MVTVAEFRAQFPEFTDTAFPDATITEGIRVGRLLHAVTHFGQSLAAAHVLALEEERRAAADGGAGVVKSEKLGPQSVTYQTQAENETETFYASTPYGRLLLALERRTPALVATARVVG